LKAHGINAASITYDSREILSNFADVYKIEYPMLSDVGSKVIRAFGIFNTNIPEDHKMLYGIPWPGEFLITPDGTVRDKMFLRSYEHRASASEVVLRHFDDAGANSVEIKTGVLNAKVSLSTASCFPGQELGLALELHLEPGWHIYGKPLPSNYQAIDLLLDSPLIGEQSLELPAPQPLLLPALGQTLPVYGGELKAYGKVGIKWSPPMPAPFLKPLGEMIKPGPYEIAGTLRFQACNDTVCEPPEAIKFTLPLTIEARIPAAPKKPN
jgi:AhpC/TSA family/Thiol:disulfide interchange protein DsbD, N-terminal